MPKIFWGTGDVFNPDVRCEKLTTDEDDDRWRVRLNLPALGGVVLK
ncbi:MAG: hypothetical protein NVV59_10645 [Chitinophagaceae bacterium]|nr:hypothetical protein [Chitinophagaceae bacterium]